jgi:hypothetical protein
MEAGQTLIGNLVWNQPLCQCLIYPRATTYLNGDRIDESNVN